MNPLRGLAKGWGYRIDDHGRLCVLDVSREIACMYYQQAPASCFADAKPAEEPPVEERTLRSPDGSFAMTVKLLADPLSIEGQIVQQPEEWRGRRGGEGKTIVARTADRLEARSAHSLAFSTNILWLRGSGRDADQRRFGYSLPDRDTFLRRLAATVAAMPRLADQFKVGDRVVVAGDVRPDGWDADAEGRPGFVGQRGIITRFSSQNSWAAVKVDSRAIARLVCLINLRHEREDERPAAATSSHCCTRAKEPDPVIGCKLLRADGISLVGYNGRRLQYPVGAMVEDVEGVGVFVAIRGGLESAGATKESGDFVAAFECWEKTSKSDRHNPNLETVPGTVMPFGIQTFHRVRRLPEIPMDRLHPNLRKEVEAWQAKQEPPPTEMPFEDGQWVVFIATSNRYRAINPKHFPSGWRYQLRAPGATRDTYFDAGLLLPCPPPLTDAQRQLLPGDKVRAREQCYDGNGKPEKSRLSRKTYDLRVIDDDTPNKILRATLRSGIELAREWLHNLDPAEEK